MRAVERKRSTYLCGIERCTPRGKGRRERALPLWKTTAAALRAWLAVHGSVASPELFVNARGQPFSRWGVAYVLRRHTKTADRKCLTLYGKQVSPHLLRHYLPFLTMSDNGAPLNQAPKPHQSGRCHRSSAHRTASVAVLITETLLLP